MRDVDLESAIMAESQVDPRGAFSPPVVPHGNYQLEQTHRVQEANRQRMAVERQRSRAMTDFEALMLQQQAQHDQDYLSIVARVEAEQRMQRAMALQQQLEAMQRMMTQPSTPVPVPAPVIQLEKAKQEITEADIYDPSPVFDRPLKRVEGVEID